MKTKKFNEIQYPNKDTEKNVDNELANHNNFKIIINGKIRQWLADKTLPYIVNEDKELYILYTLFSGLFCMDLHRILSGIDLFNQYNQSHEYKIKYDKGCIICIHIKK